MLWNEPNNKSHWMFEIDRAWTLFARMTTLASDAIRAEAPRLTQVLGGLSPIDPTFLQLMRAHGVVDRVAPLACAISPRSCASSSPTPYPPPGITVDGHDPSSGRSTALPAAS